MEIPSTLTNPILQAKESALVINKLQTGQTLKATIVDQLPNKSDVIIRLGDQLLKTKSDIPVTIGQTIKVLVEKTATEVILKVKPPPQQSNFINSSLRQLLPKQTPVNEFQQPLINVFKSINKQTIKTSSSQSPELTPQLLLIKRFAKNILHSLPSQKNITTTEGLKSAVQNSGAFLEPKLQQALIESKTTLSTNNNESKVGQKLPNEFLTTKAIGQHLNDPSRVDVKANLIKLIQVLNAWPKKTHFTTTHKNQTQQTILDPTIAPLKTAIAKLTIPSQVAPSSPQLLGEQIKELISKTEGAISKITLNQLVSSNADSSAPRQTLQLEIPFLSQHLSESIFLKIERENSADKELKETEPQWTVSLEMNPPKLGVIKNKLTVSNHRINASFWAEEPETQNLIHQHLSSFKEQLNRANLRPEKIQLQKGPGPVIQDINLTAPILSEKA